MELINVINFSLLLLVNTQDDCYLFKVDSGCIDNDPRFEPFYDKDVIDYSKISDNLDKVDLQHAYLSNRIGKPNLEAIMAELHVNTESLQQINKCCTVRNV